MHVQDVRLRSTVIGESSQALEVVEEGLAVPLVADALHGGIPIVPVRKHHPQPYRLG